MLPVEGVGSVASVVRCLQRVSAGWQSAVEGVCQLLPGEGVSSVAVCSVLPIEGVCRMAVCSVLPVGGIGKGARLECAVCSVCAGRPSVVCCVQ